MTSKEKIELLAEGLGDANGNDVPESRSSNPSQEPRSSEVQPTSQESQKVMSKVKMGDRVRIVRNDMWPGIVVGALATVQGASPDSVCLRVDGWGGGFCTAPENVELASGEAPPKDWRKEYDDLYLAYIKLVSEQRSEAGSPDVTANQLAHFKGLWDQSCQAVAELCVIAGMPEGGMPDLWTLKECIEDLRRSKETGWRLNNELEATVRRSADDQPEDLSLVPRAQLEARVRWLEQRGPLHCNHCKGAMNGTTCPGLAGIAREGWKEEDYDALVQHVRDMADDELGLQPADTDPDTLLGLIAKALFERRRDVQVLRDQYDRHVARHIEEKRELRRERGPNESVSGHADGPQEREGQRASRSAGGDSTPPIDVRGAGRSLRDGQGDVGTPDVLGARDAVAHGVAVAAGPNACKAECLVCDGFGQILEAVVHGAAEHVTCPRCRGVGSVETSGNRKEVDSLRERASVATSGTNTTPARGPDEAGTTLEGRRAPVLTNEEAIGGAQPSRVNAADEPLTPSRQPGASEEAGITSADRPSKAGNYAALKEMWDEQCSQIADMCSYLGAHPDAAPDAWTLRDMLVKLRPAGPSSGLAVAALIKAARELAGEWRGEGQAKDISACVRDIEHALVRIDAGAK